MAQLTGMVKWFNNANGFGFAGRDAGAEVFVRYTIPVDGDKSLGNESPVELDKTAGK